MTGYYLSSTKAAERYSLFKRAILLSRISFGQVSAQAPILVQDPKPSLSCWGIISITRVLCSGRPCGNKARCDTLAAVNSIAEALGQAATQAPQLIHIAAPNELSAFSFSIGMALPSTAL